MSRIVPSSTLDRVEREKIDIDDGEEREEEERLNNNNNHIILDGSSKVANELLNGLMSETSDETDGVSLECISSRKPSFIVLPDTDDDSTASPTPLVMSNRAAEAVIETAIPATEYTQSYSTNIRTQNSENIQSYSPNIRIQNSENTASSSITSSSTSKTSWFRRLLGLNRSRNKDKRLASSYASFHIGRFLAIAGSLTLLGGLFLKFLMLHDEQFWSIITWFTASAGLVLIFIGAGLVLWAALVEAQRARKEFEENLHSGGTTSTQKNSSSNKLRPASALSSSSFQSSSSRVPILGNHLETPSAISGLGQEQSPTGHADNMITFCGDSSVGNSLCVNIPQPPDQQQGKGFTPSSSSEPTPVDVTSSSNNLSPFSSTNWEKY